GRQEQIDVLEVRQQKPPAQEEVLRRNVREALVAAARRRLAARLVGARPDHLAVAVADRPELVQRVDDGGARQRRPRLPQQIDAEEERVLEVDYVGPVGAQELVVVVGDQVLVARRQQEGVEVGRVYAGQVLVGVAVHQAERRARVRGGGGRADAGQEE